MYKFYGAFPQLYCKNDINVSGVELMPLKIMGGINIVVSPLEVDSRDRKFKLLEAYLCFYSYILEGIVVRSIITELALDGSFTLLESDIDEQLDLADIISYMPSDLESTKLPIVFFAQYLQRENNDIRNKSIDLYNALGTLGGSYNSILSFGTKPEDKVLLEKLVNTVESYKKFDDDETSQVPRELQSSEIKRLENILLATLRSRYPKLFK